MYVESVPNRNSPPAILLRESSRIDGKIVKRTLANLSSWPASQIDSLRRVLKRESLVSPADAFQILRSSPHGHLAAALGTLRRLGLEPILSRSPGPERDLAVAMIVARILEPTSKLATARRFHPETATSSLAAVLGLDKAVDETQLYRSLDWLLERQQSIENALAKRHLSEGSLILYDVSSTYFEGRHCPLARFGHSRDERSGNLQIVFGLLTNAEGCPVAVEVFEGNTGDPTTVASQVNKLRERFHLKQIVLAGDRGMLTSARIREDLQPQAGLQWISALKSIQIQQLVRGGALQLSLFDQHDLAEIQHASYPGERLIACRNPLLAEERSRKRNEWLEATQKQLKKIVEATQRKKKPLRGRKEIGLAVGKILGRYKMGKHFSLFIEEDNELDRSEGKIKGGGSKGEDARDIAQAAQTGTMVGGIAGAAGGRPVAGIVGGAGVGAAAGLAGVLLTRGPDVVLQKGSVVEMVLDRPLSFEDKEIDITGAFQRPMRTVVVPAETTQKKTGNNWPVPFYRTASPYSRTTSDSGFIS